MTHVLVYGGTFDPPHIGHTLLSKKAMEHLGCQKVLFVIAAESPLKQPSNQSTATHRLAMLELALSDFPWAEISTIELERGGRSYTIDTLESLQKMYDEETMLTLLIGCDQAESFDKWHRYTDIEAIANIVVLPRNTGDTSRFELLPLPIIAVSSTQIRKRVSDGISIDDVVCPDVAAYIAEHVFYK